jgi:guanylate kinase
MKSHGMLVVISAPSGGGKTTLTGELIRRFPNSKRSITCTTRPPRATEIANQDYIFVSEQDFQKMISDGAFVEWAVVHSYKYGTRKSIVQESLDRGEILFMTIDVQGAQSIKQHFPSALTIFVMPPDFDVLETRLRKRGTENDADVRRRLENARKEIALANTFDYQVLNDRLDRAALEIESIIKKQLSA